MAEYIRVNEAAKRLGCSAQTIYCTIVGQRSIIPGTRPNLVNWDFLKEHYIKKKSSIDPRWLRRGDTFTTASNSSSFTAGEVYL